MELQQKEGELVDRARTNRPGVRLVRQGATMARLAGARCGLLDGGRLGVDAHALQPVLESDVREHLGELAEVRPGSVATPRLRRRRRAAARLT